MEYTQWGENIRRNEKSGKVLILVVMEYTQWGYKRCCVSWTP